MNIGFLGTGNMGSALVKGMIKAHAAKPNDIWLFDKDTSRVGLLSRFTGAHLGTSNEHVSERAGVIFLCVKPAQIRDVLGDVSSVILKDRSRKVIVSIAAGIPLSFLSKNLPPKTSVIRVMPNTPALLGAGAIALAKGRWAASKDLKLVQKLLSSVGETVIVRESHMNAVTAVSGSGPAYVFYLAEAMKRACQDLRLPAKVGELLYRQTILGAGLMLEKLPVDPKTLRIQVTSPGGTTEAAVRYLESRRVREHLKKAILEAAKRARELARAVR